VRDEALRAACFASLDVLCATHGDDVPYVGGLDQGFPFRARRIPFFSRYKGIHRAAFQEGAAALSLTTSFSSPYDDEAVPEGFLYAYRSGSVDQPDNRALRAACELVRSDCVLRRHPPRLVQAFLSMLRRRGRPGCTAGPRH